MIMLLDASRSYFGDMALTLAGISDARLRGLIFEDRRVQFAVNGIPSRFCGKSGTGTFIHLS
jgi:hypothetical protein